MSHFTPVANLLVSTLALFALTTCSGELESSSGPVWESAFDTAGVGSLSGVWGSGPDDVFIVGGSESGGEIYHFDGHDWSPMAIPPGTPLLVWVYGFGPDDVIAVGLDGALVRYDGAEWRGIESGIEHDLWGVFGFSPDEIWIVGGPSADVSDPLEQTPLLARFDGETFTPLALTAEQNPRDATALFKVWGIDGSLFAVGQRGWILERVDGEWRVVSGGANADQDFVSLWGVSPDEMVVVGGRGNARVAVRAGDGFETMAPSGVGGLNAVFMSDADEAIVGGTFGFVGRFDTTTLALEPEEGLGGADAVHAIWGDGEGRWYAVGGSFHQPHRGLAWRRTVQ